MLSISKGFVDLELSFDALIYFVSEDSLNKATVNRKCPRG